jgi:hypothetical protein
VWLAIGRLTNPWLTVSKVNGGALNDKVALVDRASVSKVSSANWQEALFVWALNVLNACFHGVQCGRAHHHAWIPLKGVQWRQFRCWAQWHRLWSWQLLWGLLLFADFTLFFFFGCCVSHYTHVHDGGITYISYLLWLWLWTSLCISPSPSFPLHSTSLPYCLKHYICPIPHPVLISPLFDKLISVPYFADSLILTSPELIPCNSVTMPNTCIHLNQHLLL